MFSLCMCGFSLGTPSKMLLQFIEVFRYLFMHSSLIAVLVLKVTFQIFVSFFCFLETVFLAGTYRLNPCGNSSIYPFSDPLLGPGYSSNITYNW